jgi:hypothetical protein
MIAVGITEIIGAVFMAVNYFKNPQIQLDKKQAIDKTEEEGKAAILVQRVQWEKEANEKKFAEMGYRLDTAMTTAQNHIHTVDIKVDALITNINIMSNEITRLSTIIDERIPKKSV